MTVKVTATSLLCAAYCSCTHVLDGDTDNAGKAVAPFKAAVAHRPGGLCPPHGHPVGPAEAAHLLHETLWGR